MGGLSWGQELALSLGAGAALTVALVGIVTGGRLAARGVKRAWRHARAQAALAGAARLWWRLVPLTPPGRRHERNVRRELAMPAGHPEHLTRPPSRRSARRLDALQAEAWPEGEWAEVIRMHLEGP